MTRRTQEVPSKSMKMFKASLGNSVIENRLEIEELALTLVFKRKVELR